MKLKSDINLKSYKYKELNARTIKKWFWPAPWYVTPFALPLDDWNEFYKFVSKEFPVQAFFRVKVTSKIRNLLYCWELNYWIPIKDFFNPRNKELRKLISKNYKLNSTIIEDILFKIHTSFFTEELIENWKEVDEDHPIEYRYKWRDLALAAQEINEWIKFGRDELEKEINSLYEQEVDGESERIDRWEKVEEIEKKIDKGDLKCLNWIVENRNIYD